MCTLLRALSKSSLTRCVDKSSVDFYKDLLRTSKRTQCVSIRKTDICIGYDGHTSPVNTVQRCRFKSGGTESHYSLSLSLGCKG